MKKIVFITDCFQVLTEHANYRTNPCIAHFRTHSKLVPPYHLLSSTILNDSFRFSWEDLTNHFTGYKIRIRHASDNRIILEEEIAMEQKNFKISGLLPASKYRVEIGTMRFNQVSKMNSYFVQTLPNPPKIQLGQVTETDVAIYIYKPPSHPVSGYFSTLERELKNGNKLRKIRIKKDSRRVKLNSLEPGTYYKFAISSLEGSQQSAKQEIRFLTKPAALEKLRYLCSCFLKKIKLTKISKNKTFFQNNLCY